MESSTPSQNASLSNDQLASLQEALRPKTLGMIWLSSENFSSRPNPFDQLDYFFDGLLDQTVTAQECELDHYLLQTSQFSAPFYLIFLKIKDHSKALQQLHEDLKLICKNQDQRELLFINRPKEFKTEQIKLPNSIKIKDLHIQ